MTRRSGLAVSRLTLGCLVGAALGASACGSSTPDPKQVIGPDSPDKPDKPDDAQPSEDDLPPPPENGLSDSVTPISYHLDLAIEPRRTTYTGEVAIALTLTEPTQVLWLHAEDLEVDRASVILPGGESIDVTMPPRRPRTDLLGFDLARELPAGSATIEIGFRGRMGSRVGVFRQTRAGRDYVFTDFQPIDARRAFPCFDRPQFKTPWTISLVVPDKMEAFSNMPVRKTEDAGSGKKRVVFKKTRLLPSYLVAFAVGPFDVLDVARHKPTGQPAAKRVKSPVPMRIIAPKGELPDTHIAAEMAPALLHITARYFGTNVPFPKMDLIAVPEFNGAMENPGLITIAAQIMLLSQQRASIPQQRLLAKVIAHEFAHLWFGDLVTPRDWTELWLNEGFATWLADKALIQYSAEYMHHVAQVVDKTAAMAFDHHAGARAVRQVGNARADLRSAFDPLSYRKGGALVAMFEKFLSDAVFRRAVRNYISFNSDGGVTTKSFVGALSRAAKRDLSAAFSSFLDQPGVPLVRAELSCKGDRKSVKLSQRPYVLLADRKARKSTARWQIPMCLRYGDASGAERRTCLMLDKPTKRVTLKGDRCPAWVIPNADAAGYYRYVMPIAQLKALARAPLSDREVTDLAHDLVSLLYSGDIALADALALIQELAKNPSRHTTEVIIQLLSTIHDHVISGKQRKKLSAMIRKLYGQRVRALGLTAAPGDSQEKRLLRPQLIDFVGRLGADPWVIRTARRTVQKWLRQGFPKRELSVGAVVKVAAYHGDGKLYDRLDDELRKRINQRDRVGQSMLFSALAAFRGTELVDRSLALVANPAMPGRPLFLRELLFSEAARDPALTYIDDSTALKERDPARRYLLLAPLFGPTPCDPKVLARIRKLAGRAHQTTKALRDRVADMTRESRACSAFRDAHRAAAKAAFR